MVDLIIRHGHLMDPFNGIDRVCDVAVRGGVIAAVGDLRHEQARLSVEAAGCVVAPGLIDLHTHLWPLASIGVQAESYCFPSGITTAADAGSAGSATYESHRGAVASFRVRTRIFVNVCRAGLATLGGYPENIDPRYCDAGNIERILKAYPGEIAGLKIRTGRDTAGSLGLEPLRETCALARALGTRVMVHCTDPPAPMDELLNCLDRGDILTHVYHGHGETLTSRREAMEAARRARDRGVLFDVGDAGWHMSFDVAREAIDAGFAPDTISTDMTSSGLYLPAKSFSLPFVMSKMLHLGMGLGDAIGCVTANPAKALAMEGVIGCLSVGAPADVAVLRLQDHPVSFTDGNGRVLRGERILRVMMTVKDGRPVFRDMAL